jgi:D-alanyl-D-alanine carboxypeptidase
MRRTQVKIALCLTLAVLVAAATVVQASAAPDRGAAREAKLQLVLDQLVAAGAPGVIALVRDGDRTIRLTSGYADLKTKRPMRADDRFRVGSATKAFVATVVLQLVGERKLTLGDTVERWLPGVVPNGAQISIRQLLNHTSGLFDYAEDERVLGPKLSRIPTRVWTPRELVAIATSHPPLFAPGARWAYSNTNYFLLGLIVERVTREPLAIELRRRIFAPLHLRRTSFDTKPRIAGRYAHGYESVAGSGLRDIGSISPSIYWAAGAVVSTADDLARFFRELLRGRLLRPELLRAMRTTVAVTPDQQYGLGLYRTRAPCGGGSPFWGHGGGAPGYATEALMRQDGRREFVLLVNTSESLPARAQEAHFRALALAYCGSER